MALKPCLANLGGKEPGTRIPATTEYDKQFASAYSSPSGVGITEMMKIPNKTLIKVEALLAEGKYAEAGKIVAQYSGRQATMIKKMPKSDYNKARRSYRDCTKAKVNWL